MKLWGCRWSPPPSREQGTRQGLVYMRWLDFGRAHPRGLRWLAPLSCPSLPSYAGTTQFPVSSFPQWTSVCTRESHWFRPNSSLYRADVTCVFSALPLQSRTRDVMCVTRFLWRPLLRLLHLYRSMLPPYHVSHRSSSMVQRKGTASSRGARNDPDAAILTTCSGNSPSTRTCVSLLYHPTYARPALNRRVTSSAAHTAS
jgi:hypothetical protein